jgi:hypothetical protein
MLSQVSLSFQRSLTIFGFGAQAKTGSLSEAVLHWIEYMAIEE